MSWCELFAPKVLREEGCEGLRCTQLLLRKRQIKREGGAQSERETHHVHMRQWDNEDQSNAACSAQCTAHCRSGVLQQRRPATAAATATAEAAAASTAAAAVAAAATAADNGVKCKG